MACSKLVEQKVNIIQSNVQVSHCEHAVTHLAGRSRRRSMPNTTASSPADRKEQGESGSRANWMEKEGERER